MKKYSELNYYLLPETTNKKIIKTIQDLYDSDPDKFVLIEIGANDGWMVDRMYDFVIKNDPRAIMVEPIPCYYDALKNTYSSMKNMSFEKVAIDTSSGVRKMHYIPQERFDNEEVGFRMIDTPHLEYTPHLLKEHWARGLGSFYSEKNALGCPELAQFSEKLEVNTITIDDLFEKHNITAEHNIVIQTDCEGHDLEILRTFDFSKYKPKIYICEICAMEKYPPSHPAYVKLAPQFAKQKIYLKDLDRHVTANIKLEILEYPHQSALYSLEDEKETIEIFQNNGYYPMHSKDMFAINIEWFESYMQKEDTNA